MWKYVYVLSNDAPKPKLMSYAGRKGSLKAFISAHNIGYNLR